MSNAGFDFGLQAMADFWTNAGRAMLQAQGDAGRVFLDAVAANPGRAVPPGQAAPAPDVPDLTKAVSAVSDLWQKAAELSGTFSTALASGGRTTDPTIEATFRAMADPRAWLQNLGSMDTALGRVTEGVQLADLWNVERQQTRLLRAWLDVRRRVLEHHAVVLDAWLRAGREFAAELPQRLRANAVLPVGRALLGLWTETANRVLLETQRSEPFLRTQAAMLRAGTELRVVQTELAEQWAAQLNLPTRTELDDTHRTLTELRREVRALRRELHHRQKVEG